MVDTNKDKAGHTRVMPCVHQTPSVRDMGEVRTYIHTYIEACVCAEGNVKRVWKRRKGGAMLGMRLDRKLTFVPSTRGSGGS